VLQIGDVIISKEIVSRKFVCDLEKCKGACCVGGDSGAPLDPEELEILERNYDKIKPYLTTEGRKAIESQGKYVTDSDGDVVTPLVNGDQECAYTIFEGDQARCGIEKAWQEGAVDFKKPISCHLYPIRVKKLKSGLEALNYHQWDLCKPACSLGRKLEVPVYRFLRAPLVRKYGEQWYQELEMAVKEIAT
jgi:hypothetical protein